MERETPQKIPNGKVIRMPRPVNGPWFDPTDPTPVSGCRPTTFMLDARRDGIVNAIVADREHRSIAAQYGLTVGKLFSIAASEIRRLRKKLRMAEAA